jgi:cysteinyl-tRNA synthetase
MELRNTLTRSVEQVQPITPGHVGVYSCGPTVYSYAHLGNLRTYLLADLIRRIGHLEGLDVTLVQNITDVGHMTDATAAVDSVDKMLVAAEDEGLAPLEIAAKYTEAAVDDAAAIGIAPPTVMPRATEHIPEMIDLTQRLIEAGHAYAVATGSVYYDVTSFSTYGALSGNTLEHLQAGHRDLEIDPAKRHPADFALWKAASPDRLMQWDSPWGSGFPGWHIECSAMSMRYLGDRFEIHTGGTDLRFPHHEDEIAQSDGATGHQVVGMWAHAGHLRLAGQKISKSTGHKVRVPDLTARGLDPLAFRLLTFQTRYRSEMDLSWDAMEGADQRLRHLRRKVADWARASEDSIDGDTSAAAAAAFDARFREAVCSDVDLPAALVVVNDLIAKGGATISETQRYGLLVAWDAVLGLDLDRDATSAWRPDEQVRDLVAERDEARSIKDYARSDELRARLEGLGFEVMDTANGTQVRPRG